MQQFAPQRLRHHFGEPGFAGARGACEEENANGLVALGERKAAAQLPGEVMADLVLADDLALQARLHRVCVKEDGFFVEFVRGFFNIGAVAEAVEYVHGNNPVNPVGGAVVRVQPHGAQQGEHEEERRQQIPTDGGKEIENAVFGTGDVLPQHQAEADEHQQRQQAVNRVHGLLQVEADDLAFRHDRQ